jgi:hypothetical protein
MDGRNIVAIGQSKEMMVTNCGAELPRKGREILE